MPDIADLRRDRIAAQKCRFGAANTANQRTRTAAQIGGYMCVCSMQTQLRFVTCWIVRCRRDAQR